MLSVPGFLTHGQLFCVAVFFGFSCFVSAVAIRHLYSIVSFYSLTSWFGPVLHVLRLDAYFVSRFTVGPKLFIPCKCFNI